jgi:ribose/xylose/arabinose/galactoside ABC-type transport system permease subunit
LITNLFILNGLNTSDQLIAKGIIIVIAVLLQRERAPRTGGRLLSGGSRPSASGSAPP